MSTMSEELDVIKASLQKIYELADIKSNPVVESVLMPMIKVFPVLGNMVDSGINMKINDEQDKKEQELVEYILKNKYKITTNMVNDIEFIINSAKCHEAVRRLATNDKVKFFGNLIRNGYLSGEHIESSEFEEYLDTLSTLSYRQLECLAEFYQRSRSTNGRLVGKEWKEFKKSSKYPENDVNFIFKRLSKTGFINECYTTITFMGGDEDLDGILPDMNGTFDGYELDESFMKFYDKVLKME